MLRPRRRGWCGVKRGAKLAGSGVRRGVQCGGARRPRNKSRYSAAIRQNLVGVTEGWPPRPLSIPDAGSARANGTEGDATSRSFFIKFGNRALLSKNRARSSSLDPKVQTGPLAFPVHTHMLRHRVKISLRTAQVRHAWEGDPAA